MSTEHAHADATEIALVVPHREIAGDETAREMTAYEKRLATYKARRAGIIRTAEVAAGAAFGTALYNKASAGMAFGAGVALNVLAFTPIGEEYGEHLKALGDGCIASYVTILMLPKPGEK